MTRPTRSHGEVTHRRVVDLIDMTPQRLDGPPGPRFPPATQPRQPSKRGCVEAIAPRANARGRMGNQFPFLKRCGTVQCGAGGADPGGGGVSGVGRATGGLLGLRAPLSGGIAAARRRRSRGVVAMGERMATVRDLLPRGEWRRWIDEALPFTPRTVGNYIMLAQWHEERPQDIERLAHLGPTKLYLLRPAHAGAPASADRQPAGPDPRWFPQDDRRDDGRGAGSGDRSERHDDRNAARSRWAR